MWIKYLKDRIGENFPPMENIEINVFLIQTSTPLLIPMTGNFQRWKIILSLFFQLISL